MSHKKTLVIGASDNPERYAYKAMKMLQEHNHPVVAVGRKQIETLGVEIEKEKVHFDGIDTVTLYLNPKKPSRILRLYLEPTTQKSNF